MIRYILKWSEEKNEWLKATRGISFEWVEEALSQDGLLGIEAHPNVLKYPHQKMMYLKMNSYCYCVPFVETEEGFFLKTIYPSRKRQKQARGVNDDEEKNRGV